MLFFLTGLVLFIIWVPLDKDNPCADVKPPAALAGQTTNQPQPSGSPADQQAATLAQALQAATEAQRAAAQVQYAATTNAFNQCLDYRTGLLDRRKDFLALLISAFGAWVGAGAAYFFGRENLRVAANSLLQMQQQTSGVDRLRTTLINQVPPLSLGWLAKETDKLRVAYEWLKADPMRWFIPVVNADGVLVAVLKGEALFRFLIDAPHASPPLSPPGDVLDMTIGQALKYINERDEYKQFRQVYVTVSGNMSVETANELMDRQGIFLAIVVDDKRKPTHFITTAEVRKLLLK